MFGLAVSTDTLLVFLVLFVMGLYWIRRPRNLPPGPWGLPIIGNMFALRPGQGKQPFEVFTEWSKKYGPVFSIRLGLNSSIVLNEYRSVKEALVKQPDVFAGRVGQGLFKATDGVEGSIVFESGPIWKERRRFGIGALRSFGVGKKSIETSINEEARYLIGCISDNAGKPFDPTHTVNNAVSNIICKITFGYRFEYSDLKFAGLLRRLRTRFSAESMTSPLGLFPWLAYTPLYSSLRKDAEETHKFVYDIVQEHRSSYDGNDMRDIIDMHLREFGNVDAENTFGKDAFNDRVLGVTIETFFIAGSDTTTNTILWLLAYMCRYPDVQKKVQTEIDEVVGNCRQPSLADRTSMPYTSAVIWETMRIRPIAPFTPPYTTLKETSLEGYTIPKDTFVMINIWALHHNPDNFPQPEKYDPSRFLSADGKTVIRHETLIPFSLGRHVCLGESLAKDEIFLFFVNILQQFKLVFPEGKPTPSLKGLFGLVLKPGPFEMCTLRRK